MEDLAEALRGVLSGEEKVLAAYLFGSKARGESSPESDVDVAVLLSELPENLLDFYLSLAGRLVEAAGNVDLVIANLAPPALNFQVISRGRLVYCRDERARIAFEARVLDEFMDLSRALRRYDECMLEEILSR